MDTNINQSSLCATCLSFQAWQATEANYKMSLWYAYIFHLSKQEINSDTFTLRRWVYSLWPDID